MEIGPHLAEVLEAVASLAVLAVLFYCSRAL